MMNYLPRIVALAALVCLAGCIYHHKGNDLSYVFNTHYNVFDLKNEPDFTFSNFVGFCMMPMKDPEDVRAIESLELLQKYIKDNGYVQVMSEDLLRNEYVATRTFVVSFGYTEEFIDGSIEVQVNLHAIDPRSTKDTVFWSWQAEFDGYPLTKKTLEPSLVDIFKKEPLDWSRRDRLFPELCAQSNVVETFIAELERARGARK